ncbi:Acetylglutamate kinase [Sulfurimonas gotlandica GD1]|uniref:Acetylglutamate kinase n=1 Tax=Sulfurimonas gotlandica (strain DSM 19862 / JCM 16533 / GD1) TaxID=929558 RepID=B6BLM7_SULGG|nr:acetylglutamate kinase [Sulfurimonas gotlandica]EDZ62019.1 acetylglutamate kinase [Sulfurimonas gotlandica GD1]EHP28685.1 Acetylglutamate kinase [Sulfurimonas gotlandica GD1]
MQKKIETVKTLLDALPFIKEFTKEIIVIKYGGSAQETPQLKEKFAEDILLMYLVGIRPVIVHGGGPKINDMLEALKIDSKFIDGQRVTSKEVMRIVEMVLSGEINKDIVSLLNSHGAKAIGVSGKDAHFITAKPKDFAKWGLTGNITNVKADVLQKLIDDKFIPVIAPIAAGEEMGHPGYNINADLCASYVAKAIGANKIIFLTDTAGVLNNDKELLETLTKAEVEALKADGTIHGGMVPKVDACLEAIEGGVQKAHIIDGRIEHSMLLELFTSEGVGTQIIK